MRAALEGDSLEGKLKMQAAIGQSPSLSKPKGDAPPPLARAPISKPATELPPTAAQLAGLALSETATHSSTAGRAGTGFSEIATLEAGAEFSGS